MLERKNKNKTNEDKLSNYIEYRFSVLSNEILIAIGSLGMTIGFGLFFIDNCSGLIVVITSLVPLLEGSISLLRNKLKYKKSLDDGEKK